MDEDQLYSWDFENLSDEEVRTLLYTLIAVLGKKVMARKYSDNLYREFTIENE